jgi:hypothetical protein
VVDACALIGLALDEVHGANAIEFLILNQASVLSFTSHSWFRIAPPDSVAFRGTDIQAYSNEAAGTA